MQGEGAMKQKTFVQRDRTQGSGHVKMSTFRWKGKENFHKQKVNLPLNVFLKERWVWTLLKNDGNATWAKSFTRVPAMKNGTKGWSIPVYHAEWKGLCLIETPIWKIHFSKYIAARLNSHDEHMFQGPRWV